MKKKIKDLTITECLKICENYHDCKDCPLEHALCEDRFSWSDDEELEKEVDVDENRTH